MSLLKFIDRKLTSREQITYLKSYLFFGAPLGYMFVEGFKYFFISNYHFSVLNLISNLITNILIASPFLINYYKHRKKYNRIHKKIKENPKINRVKSIFNYDNFVKNESYEFKVYTLTIGYLGTEYIFDKNRNIFSYNLKDNINKFELDDIKEERLKKLKRLKWKN